MVLIQIAAPNEITIDVGVLTAFIGVFIALAGV